MVRKNQRGSIRERCRCHNARRRQPGSVEGGRGRSTERNRERNPVPHRGSPGDPSARRYRNGRRRKNRRDQKGQKNHRVRAGRKRQRTDPRNLGTGGYMTVAPRIRNISRRALGPGQSTPGKCQTALQRHPQRKTTLRPPAMANGRPEGQQEVHQKRRQPETCDPDRRHHNHSIPHPSRTGQALDKREAR